MGITILCEVGMSLIDTSSWQNVVFMYCTVQCIWTGLYNSMTLCVHGIYTALLHTVAAKARAYGCCLQNLIYHGARCLVLINFNKDKEFTG